MILSALQNLAASEQFELVKNVRGMAIVFLILVVATIWWIKRQT